MAGLADCGTTGLALAVGRGLAEQNPIGPVAACLLKPVAVEVSSRYDEPQRTANLQLTKAMWYGVTANNAASIVVVLAHATAPPLAPFTIGIATAYLIWRSGAEEREYAAICAGWKKDNPGFICEPYKKKE